MLFHVTVYKRLDVNSRPGIQRIHNYGSNWTKCVEAFPSGPLPIFFLQIASGHVVDAGISQNVGPDVFIDLQIPATLADDHAEFSFMINAS